MIVDLLIYLGFLRLKLKIVSIFKRNWWISMDFILFNRSGIQDSEIVQSKNDKFVSKTVVGLKVEQRLHLLHLEQIYSFNLIVIWHRMDMNVNVISIKSMARWVSLNLFFSCFLFWFICEFVNLCWAKVKWLLS